MQRFKIYGSAGEQDLQNLLHDASMDADLGAGRGTARFLKALMPVVLRFASEEEQNDVPPSELIMTVSVGCANIVANIVADAALGVVDYTAADERRALELIKLVDLRMGEVMVAIVNSHIEHRNRRLAQ